MIIVLKGADFSASNIGTLSSWRITRSLGAGATYIGPTSVDKGAELRAIISIAEGYEFNTAGIIITMGGVVLGGDNYDIGSNGITIEIPSVTGNVVIKVPTTSLSEDITYCTVTYKYMNETNHVIRDDVTEQVEKGTAITITSGAPEEFNGYNFVSASQTGSIVINSNTEIIYNYTRIIPTETTWYVNPSATAAPTNKGGKGAASYVYIDPTYVAALENRTINAVCIACSTAGTFAYGKVNPVTNTYTKIGTITLSSASSSTPNFKVYTFDPFVLEKDE